MATREITTENNADTGPVACALTSEDLAAQTTHWQDLAARAMTKRTETAHGLRISFRPEPGVEDELHKLVAVENRCCAWATWTVQRATHQVVLEISSVGEGIAILHNMFVGPQLARGASGPE
jgi:hypothetical protein